MQIKKRIRFLVAVLLLALLTVVQAQSDPPAAQNEGKSDTPAQPPTETPTTQPGKTRAEGADTPDYQPFTPSETISADSAIAFPVDI